MIRLLYTCSLVILQIVPCFAGSSLVSYTHSYVLETNAGSDSDIFVLPSVPATECDSGTIVSAYSSAYCWSPGSADPLDSAWALLYGSQQTCAELVSGTSNVTGVSSSTAISGGVIYPGCDLGNPDGYDAIGHAAVSIFIEITDSPADYSLSYSLLGEDWGGEITGGNTTISGYFRFSRQGGQALVEDTLFAGVAKIDVISSGTLQPGVYELTYAINHIHSGTDLSPWFPNGQSSASFALDFGTANCGDIDVNGQVDITDAVYLINYMFAGGLAPQDPRGGDTDCNNQTDITDAVYLINYMFASGPVPCATCP